MSRDCSVLNGAKVCPGLVSCIEILVYGRNCTTRYGLLHRFGNCYLCSTCCVVYVRTCIGLGLIRCGSQAIRAVACDAEHVSIARVCKCHSKDFFNSALGRFRVGVKRYYLDVVRTANRVDKQTCQVT